MKKALLFTFLLVVSVTNTIGSNPLNNDYGNIDLQLEPLSEFSLVIFPEENPYGLPADRIMTAVNESLRYIQYYYPDSETYFIVYTDTEHVMVNIITRHSPGFIAEVVKVYSEEFILNTYRAFLSLRVIIV